jgi:hypothetical protein
MITWKVHGVVMVGDEHEMDLSLFGLAIGPGLFTVPSLQASSLITQLAGS